ncbi:MAG: non-homologous end-joining DNA ligase [Gemmatimonadaceae bacterium]
MISHPEKVLFPDDGITKGQLASYYEAVAPVMLPHVLRRPVTMERFHKGIAEDGFFQKSVTKGFPEWLERVEVPKQGGTVHHPLVTDRRSLLWMANQNCITLHVWSTRAPDLFHPDVCVFDLDPAEDEPERLRAAVLSVRDFLAELGLTSLVKTTGSKGFHVVVPLDGKTTVGDVARFSHVVGIVMVERDPQNFTLEFSKVDRGGRIYMDTGRNHPPATFAATYTVRARRGAPVSAPCTWEEIERGKVHPQTFTLRNMAARLASVGDLWADLKGQSLRAPIEKLRKLHK